VRRWLTLAAAVVAAAVTPGVATAGLGLLKPTADAKATFVGKGGYSADGLGQSAPGGFLDAEVPAGSTVVHAYLYGTYFRSEPAAADYAINFDGTTVTLAKIGTVPGRTLYSARADVTAQVAQKVGAGGAITRFQVLSDPSTLNGVALVVIYANPARPTTTIAVLDGAAVTEGDVTTFAFSKPVDPSAPKFSATMSLGSGHSYQGVAGHDCGNYKPAAPQLPQSSTLDVNGNRVSSCAGSFDDGVGADGGLITVGGVGDTTANPSNPDQLPGDGTNPRTTDDELYNVEPFLTQGDTALEIKTANASKDDIVFLAVIAITAEAGVSTGSTLPPPQAGKTFNAAVVRGKVTCRNSGARVFKPVTKATQFKVGTECDASKGAIRITSAAGRTVRSRSATPTQSAIFFAGTFTLTQTKGTAPVTELTLTGGNFNGCPKVKGRYATKPKPIRRLWGRGKGRFRTKGKYSSATVRGTYWEVQDRCDGTLTTVREGQVEVLDYFTKKKVVVQQGKSYLVKAHRGRGGKRIAEF
jgi:hypothetical protein